MNQPPLIQTALLDIDKNPDYWTSTITILEKVATTTGDAGQSTSPYQPLPNHIDLKCRKAAGESNIENDLSQFTVGTQALRILLPDPYPLIERDMKALIDNKEYDIRMVEVFENSYTRMFIWQPG